MDKSFNPCDECDYAFHKQNQESGMCKICEFKKLQESQIDAIELCKIKIALDKLKEYQYLEEQGLLMKLPCKVGDVIYVIPSKVNFKLNVLHGYEEHNRIYEQPVCSVQMWSDQRYSLITCEGLRSVVFDTYKETWFLTREEAEQALQRMKEGGE